VTLLRVHARRGVTGGGTGLAVGRLVRSIVMEPVIRLQGSARGVLEDGGETVVTRRAA
jgi:hypothetical protein